MAVAETIAGWRANEIPYTLHSCRAKLDVISASYRDLGGLCANSTSSGVKGSRLLRSYYSNIESRNGFSFAFCNAAAAERTKKDQNLVEVWCCAELS
jgi:hypothetical protein